MQDHVGEKQDATPPQLGKSHHSEAFEALSWDCSSTIVYFIKGPMGFWDGSRIKMTNLAFSFLSFIVC